GEPRTRESEQPNIGDHMNKLVRALMALFFFCVLYSAAAPIARATTITITSQTVPNFQARTSGPIYLRIYVNQSFVTSGGVPLQASSPGSNSFYQQITCSLAGGVISIPQFTIDSTTDGLDITTATYSAVWFDATGAQLQPFAGFERFR